MKKIIALLLIFAMCLSFIACDSNKKEDVEDDVKISKVNKDICASCFRKMVGEWFAFVYNEETEGNELKTAKVTEEGKLIIDGKEYILKSEACSKVQHNGSEAYDTDGNHIFNLMGYYSEEEGDLPTLRIYRADSGEGHTYRSINNYTIIEVTEENWQQYFSADINETFDEILTLQIHKDDWGDIAGGCVSRKFVLKDYEKYAYGTELTMEYSYGFGDVYCEFDVANETVTRYDFAANDERVETIKMEYYNYDNSSEELYMNSSDIFLSKEKMLVGSAKESWCNNPQEILRMKGWLVIRNDT